MTAQSRPPSVDALARSIADVGLPHPVLVEAARAAIAAGEPDRARARAEESARLLLGPVINATGVLLHTNLGRAPLAVHQPAAYSNLELDLATGRRGSRQAHAGRLLALACGAQAALVVNNGAAAVLLVLAALARGRPVLVSRGELVEIGGGFRVPDVMTESGARLVEVGTTNRTRLADYEAAAAGTEVALVLKVHKSNYRITGFTEEVEVGGLAGVGPPVVVDLGSGLLDTATPWLASGPPPWLSGEPAARQTLADGAALVTFSGDKLLGGPQAGIVAGRRDLIEQCGRHPLMRPLRPGGHVLRALQELVLAYLRRDGDAIPFWRMAGAGLDALRDRAQALAAAAGPHVTVATTAAVTGGGTLPGVEIPSVGLSVDGDHVDALRSGAPPVIARVESGRTLCDLRSVDPTDDEVLVKALASLG